MVRCKRKLDTWAGAAIGALLCAGTLACGNTATTADAAAEDVADAQADSTTADDLAPDVPVQLAWDDNPDCDPLQPLYCSLPWPSNHFLLEDKTTETGYRLKFGAKSLPQNAGGTYISGKAWEKQDGYSVSAAILVHFPSVSLAGEATELDLSPSLAADGHVRLWAVHGSTWTRVPFWMELDQAEADPARQLVNIRPGVILEAGTRYVIAFAGLQDTSGKKFAPSPAFAALQAGTTTGTNLGKRQARFDALFAELKAQGLEKGNLQLSWDFVTASDSVTHGDMLSIRDQGMAAVGALGPELKIKSVVEHTEAENAEIAVDIEGTFRAPHFMDPHPLDGHPAFIMHRDSAGKPAQNGWVEQPFWVRIPRVAVNGPAQGLNQYGHGLNGTGHQVFGSFNAKIGNQYNLIPFACNWTGMSSPDVPSIIQMILNFTDFRTMSDHLQQGMMEQLILMRAMHERFADLPEVKKYGIQIDKKRLYYTGISQGGIYGATYMALSQEVTRGHLGVPGHSYSLLLQRSVDFDPFLLVVSGNYPDAGDRLIVLSLIQMLWDASDPASYYVHLKQQPFPNTPPHDVLLVPAKGDYQVAPVTNEIVARSGFAELMEGWGRPVPGVKERAYPYKGSGVVIYDFGNDWAAPGNKPPAGDVEGGKCKVTADCTGWMECDEGYCILGDPHDRPQRLEWRNKQLVHFLDTGEIIDVCGGDGCHPD